MTAEELKTQVDEALADAAIAHPWLQSAVAGRGLGSPRPDPDQLLAGLVALGGSLIDAVNLITEYLRTQDASR